MSQAEITEMNARPQVPPTVMNETEETLEAHHTDDVELSDSETSTEVSTAVTTSFMEAKANECRVRIKNSFLTATKAFYDLSQDLLEAYDNDYPRLWGYANFVSYCDGELDMKSSMAYGLLDVARTVNELSIPRSRVEAIGWSKMNQLSKALTENPDDADRLLGMAENMSRRDLHEALKQEVTVTDAKAAKAATVRISLKFEGDAAAVVSDGLALAYSEIGQENASLALTHVMGEWLMARNGGAQSASLEDWTAYLEKLYGVKLVKAEASEDLNMILDAKTSTQEEEDDAALEDLLK